MATGLLTGFLRIPLKSGTHCVAVTDEDLKNSKIAVSQVADILTREKCSLALWKTAALFFFKFGHITEAEVLLKRAVDAATAAFLQRREKTEEQEEVTDTGIKRLGDVDAAKKIQQIDLCITLAALQVHKVTSKRPFLEKSYKESSSTSGSRHRLDEGPKEAEGCCLYAQELLRQAEVVFRSMLPVTPEGSLLLGPLSGRGDITNALLELEPYPGLSNACQNAEKLYMDSLNSLSLVTEATQALSPAVCAGYVCLARTIARPATHCSRAGDLTKATHIFQGVLAVRPECLLAILGLASVQYVSQRYREALQLYGKALYLCPKGPAHLRLGIALCQLQLGAYEKAAQAFRRVLQLDSRNMDALYALSTLEMRNGLVSEGSLKQTLHCQDVSPTGPFLSTHCFLEKSLEYLREAVTDTSLDTLKTYPQLLLAVSNAVFFAEDYDAAQRLLHCCREGLDGTNNRIVAECSYQQGRLQHCRGDAAGAAAFYDNSLKADPSHAAARYGLGQVLIALGHLKAAEKHLQALLRLGHPTTDTLVLLAYNCFLLGQEADRSNYHDEMPSQTASFLSSSQDDDTPMLSNNRSAHLRTTDRDIRRQQTNQRQKSQAMAADYFAIASHCLSSVLPEARKDKEVLLLFIAVQEAQYRRGCCWVLPSLKRAYENLLEIRFIKAQEKDGNHEATASCSTLSLRAQFLDGMEHPPLELISNLGVLYAIDTQHDKALALFAACLKAESISSTEITSAKAVILFNKALVLESQGNQREAVLLYKQLQEKVPALAAPWERRCWVAIKMGDTAKAEAYYTKAAQSGVPLRVMALLLARMYLSQNRFDKAAQIIKKALASEASHSTKEEQNWSMLDNFESEARTLLGIVAHRQAGRVATRHTSYSHLEVASQLAAAGRYYREALKWDTSNAFAANGLAVLMAEQNLLTPAREAFALILDSVKAVSAEETRDANEGTAETAKTPVSYAASSPGPRSILPALLKAACHQNAGLVFLSQAMAESLDVAQEHKALQPDILKVEKALRHFQSAIRLRPLSQSLHLQLARLYFDACRFRESQQALEIALLRGASTSHAFLLRHNMARVLQKAVLSEMQVEDLILDPRQVRQWIMEIKLAQSYIRENAHALKQSSRTALQPTSGKMRLLGSNPSENGLAIYAAYIGDISLLDQFQSQLSTLYQGLCQTLPRVEAEWKERTSIMENMQAQSHVLRRKLEADEARQRKESEKIAQQQTALDQHLQQEAKNIAEFIGAPTSLSTPGQRESSDSEKSWDGEQGGDGFITSGAALPRDGLTDDDYSQSPKRPRYPQREANPIPVDDVSPTGKKRSRLQRRSRIGSDSTDLLDQAYIQQHQRKKRPYDESAEDTALHKTSANSNSSVDSATKDASPNKARELSAPVDIKHTSTVAVAAHSFSSQDYPSILRPSVLFSAGSNSASTSQSQQSVLPVTLHLPAPLKNNSDR